ncbi:MAG TPA: RAMP superfamily CRISPR-associated protein [Alphaproteobacteria bacterium]|nr:RAMP superfamily CRISPR-associated protein [Alphaproteobacteria bacterium]
MANSWVRCTLTAELLSDAHPGSGSGGGGIDALVACDRHRRPVIWASHVEGVLRDAARRLRGDAAAESFFGRAGGQQQRAMFTSLYVQESPESRVCESRVWRSTARKAFDNYVPKEDTLRQAFYNRAPKDDTLRAIEYVPKGTRFVGEVELPADELPVLQRLVKEVDALGGGRASGSGRVKLSFSEAKIELRAVEGAPGRLLLLLKNRDPLCITVTATPDNLIPSLSFVPGRALLGALAAWLITEGHQGTASLLTEGRVSVSDALPLPETPANLESVEVLPAPLSLQSEKPKGAAGQVPWWAQLAAPTQRLDAWSASADEKLKRPEDDLFVYRSTPNDPWTAFRPACRVRLRNGRPDPKQADASLFAIEQIAEGTYFLAELRGSSEDMKQLAEQLAPVLGGARWLRVGRGGAPVEVVRIAWINGTAATQAPERALLILTSDLLVRDECLRWRTALDEAALKELVEVDDLQVVKSDRGTPKIMQDSEMVHGFNGTSRLWRMPAAAIRRGSVFEVSGSGVRTLAERAAKGEWLGERTHEGFGHFRLDDVLPGVTGGPQASGEITPRSDDPEEVIAKETQSWFEQHKTLARLDGERKPSLSQWMDLVGDLERSDPNAIESRLQPTTAGAKSWKHKDATVILNKLKQLQPKQHAASARYFVRWLRAELRANRDKEAV